MPVYRVAVGDVSPDTYVVEANTNMDASDAVKKSIAVLDPDCMVTIEHITDNSVIRAENQ